MATNVLLVSILVAARISCAIYTWCLLFKTTVPQALRSLPLYLLFSVETCFYCSLCVDFVSCVMPMRPKKFQTTTCTACKIYSRTTPKGETFCHNIQAMVDASDNVCNQRDLCTRIYYTFLRVHAANSNILCSKYLSFYLKFFRKFFWFLSKVYFWWLKAENVWEMLVYGRVSGNWDVKLYTDFILSGKKYDSYKTKVCRSFRELIVNRLDSP